MGESCKGMVSAQKGLLPMWLPSIFFSSSKYSTKQISCAQPRGFHLVKLIFQNALVILKLRQRKVVDYKWVNFTKGKS